MLLWIDLLVRFFPGLLTIPFACQCFLDATLFTRFQIEGVALNFLNDVLLLNLPLESAQCVFERFALLDSNLCQKKYTSKHPHMGSFMILQSGGVLLEKDCGAFSHQYECDD